MSWDSDEPIYERDFNSIHGRLKEICESDLLRLTKLELFSVMAMMGLCAHVDYEMSGIPSGAVDMAKALIKELEKDK